MKTFFAKSFLCAAITVGSPLFADTVAVVDLYKIVKSLPSLQQVQDDIQKEASLAQGKLNNKKVQLDAKIQEYETSKDTLSDQKSEKMRKEITALQRELKYLEGDLREDLALKEQEQKNALIKQAMDLASDYAEKNKIDVVLPLDQVVYYNDSKDITSQIIATLTASKTVEVAAAKAQPVSAQSTSKSKK